MKIGTKLKLLLIFLTISLITTSALSFWMANKFTNQISDLGEVQLPGSINMTYADMMHDGIRANVFSAIIAVKDKKPEELKAVKEESVEFAANIRKYVANLQKIDMRPETKNAIAPALPKIETYVKSAEEIVDIALSGDEVKAREHLIQFGQRFSELETDLGVLGELIEKDAKESTSYGAVIKRTGLYINLISLLIGIVLLIYFKMVMNEQQNQLETIVSNLNEESQKLKKTALGITSSSQALSRSTTDQSSACQESSSALSEISSTALLTQDNTKKLKNNSTTSFESAQDGQNKMEQMLQAMQIINESNESVRHQIEEGNKRIGEIVSVINAIENKTKVINDIVFQTKLLSFNASVEAARAGESGKGFAVVAEEVGNLAAMSGNAALEISEMLTSSIQTVNSILSTNKSNVESQLSEGKNKVNNGIEIAHGCGSSLKTIVLQASMTNELIKEISTAIEEQTIGITEISGAMNQLDQLSQQNLVISTENLNSSIELQNQVQNLEGAVDSLSSMLTRS